MKKTSVSTTAFIKLRLGVALLLVCASAALAVFGFSRGASAQNNDQAKTHDGDVQYRGLAPVAQFDVSPPLRDIKPIDPSFGTKRENEDRDVVPIRWRFAPELDTVVQSEIPLIPLIPPPLIQL